MIKNTYLAKESPSLPDSRLVEISGEDWYRIVEENKNLPKEERRYFIVSTIRDGDLVDRMYMESSEEEYRIWHIEKTMSDERLKSQASIKLLSLDGVPDIDCLTYFNEGLSDGGSMEEAIHEQSAVESLTAAVKVWEPWAYDLLLSYQAGNKRSCTQELAKKYGISEQAMRRRKKQFEEFCKNFFEE